MTINGIASAALQALANMPPAKIMQAIAVRVARDQLAGAKDVVKTLMETPQQIPPQVYNSRGEVTSPPSVSSLELKA